VCQGVNGEVFPYWRRGHLRTPIEAEVNGGEAYRNVRGQVLGLKEEREGQDCGSLAEAELAFGGAQAILRAARRLLYLQ